VEAYKVLTRQKSHVLWTIYSTDGGEVVSLKRRLPFSDRKIAGTEIEVKLL
jgi:hypothetical protein